MNSTLLAVHHHQDRSSEVTIEIGKSYEFYCEVQQEYEPASERLRNYTGQQVTVVESVPVDPECSPVYRVRAADGREFTAHEEELSGWDKRLGQFFWADGTYGPDHDRAFLINEREES